MGRRLKPSKTVFGINNHLNRFATHLIVLHDMVPANTFIAVSFYFYIYILIPNAYTNTKNPVMMQIATPNNTPVCPLGTPSNLFPFPPLTAEAAALPPPDDAASVELTGNVVVPVTVPPPPHHHSS